MKNFYITTAIDYANGAPHLGHAYEKVLADVMARIKRLEGKSVYFLTGLDEHGQKVQQTAEGLGVEPQALCDTMAVKFKDMCEKMGISYDQYIRTTDKHHKEVVRGILQKLFDDGLIYKHDYKGHYSVKEEQFVQEKDKIDGQWPANFGKVIEISEPNYFFKLSAYKDWLVEYIHEHPDFIFPKFRAKQVLEFLKEDINDLCISRPKERLSWGIPLPFDPEFVTYVWFDALINYISAVGYGTDDFSKNWPVDYHVIGKDILVPAHGVYWPIMLKAMGAPLPKTLLVHGWWLSSGNKMSKSVGNTVAPLELADKYGADALRFFLIREMNVGQDSDFSMDLFLSHYNNVLGNDLGNLLSRLLNMASRYCESKVPGVSIEEEPEKELKALWETHSKEVLEMYDSLQLNRGLESLFTFIRGINRYVEVRAPWKLAKSEDAEGRKRLETSLANIAEGLRLAIGLLHPVMPRICDQIRDLLGLKHLETWKKELVWDNRVKGSKLGEKAILFPRVEVEEKAST